MTNSNPSVGDLLREWRQRRHLSQLGLASDAEISQRHLSFVESGRSAPSRAMVLRLAEQLEIPLRERNALLVAAGFAPVYPNRPLDDPGMEAAREAIGLILHGHEPNPALAIDRHWTLVSANRAVAHLLAGVDADLLQPPVNVLRLSLHPRGLAPRIGNYREWRAHVIGRLARQVDNSADPVLTGLLAELKALPVPPGARPCRPHGERAFGGVAVPLDLATEHGTLSFISTTTIFGTALEISLSEIAIESFFPADRVTAMAMRQWDEGAVSA
jgi:transcriptional regulator with XRE-family HTH domain